jgi:hypothetical protein
VAVAPVAEAAVITYNVAAGVCTVEAYTSVYDVGALTAPTVTSGATGVSTIAFPTSYEAPDGTHRPFHVIDAEVFPSGTTAVFSAAESSGGNIVVRTSDASGTLVDARVTVVATADAPIGRHPRIGDYDGALDKENCATEVTPYAWVLYQELGAALGSAYTPETSGQVHSRKLALARANAAALRSAERQPLNAIPGTSDVMLGEWVSLLSVPLRGDENRQEVRQLADAAFRQRTRGNDMSNVDESVQEVLGNALVAVIRNYGATLSAPPPLTFWPGINPGHITSDLGGGTWSSERSHIGVQVAKPASGSVDADFSFLVDVKLYRLLDEYLPAWCTFAWATSDGFILDLSQLDLDGL